MTTELKRWVIVGPHGRMMFHSSFPVVATPMQAWSAYISEFVFYPEDFAKALKQDLERGYKAIELTYREVEKEG